MRKLHLAIVPTSLAALVLSGCGGQSSSSAVSDDLDSLIVKVGQLDAATATAQSNELYYTKSRTVDYNGQTVSVPGSLSPQAAYVDQSLGLIADAQAIANDPNSSARQRSTANQIIADIFTDEASYLIKTGQDDFVRLRLSAGALQDEARQIAMIRQSAAELAGDRDAVIQTIRTGETGDGTNVGGINALEDQAEHLSREARDAQAAHDDTAGQISTLEQQVAEYEALELDLRNQAQVATGATRFDKMDQAIRAQYEADLAAAKAERLALDAQISGQQAELAQTHRERLTAVIQDLEAKIAAIEQEKRLIAGKLTQLETIRANKVSSLEDAFDRIDAQIQVLALGRFTDAADRLAQAEQALAGVQISGQGRTAAELNELSTYIVHARALQAEVLATRAYRDTLNALAAAGSDVIGRSLEDKVMTRIDALDARIDALIAAAAALADPAQSLIGSLQNSYEADSPEARLVTEHAELFGTMQQDIAGQ